MDSDYIADVPPMHSYCDPGPVVPPVPPSAETLASRALGERIVAHSGRLSAGTCRWLLMVAEFDQRDGASAFGLPTTSAWLSYSCGLTRRTAIEHVRVARYLAAFPELAAQMSAGRLSYSQVRAISRALTLPTAPSDAAEEPSAPPAVSDANTSGPAEAATDAEPVDPAATASRTAATPAAASYADELINLARSGTVAQLESVVRGLRTVASIEATEAGAPPPERVGIGWNADGTWRLSARLLPERGAVVESALKRLGERESLTREDALLRLAEIALAHLNAADGDATEPPALNSEDRAAVVIHLDADRIPQPTTARGPVGRSAEHPTAAARIADGPGLPDAVALRLVCDGRIRTVVTSRDGDRRRRILDVGRSHRLATKRQRRALLLRHGGRCAHPGCENRRGLEAHHVIHWLHGGPTDLDNLILLCPNHHHRHHEGAFTIAAEPGGRFAFALADGRPLPQTVDASPLVVGAPPIEADHPDVAARAATAEWLGDRLDRPYAVSVLAAHRPPAA